MNEHAEGQSMSGRVALVAGASKGIGAATATGAAATAPRPARLSRRKANGLRRW